MEMKMEWNCCRVCLQEADDMVLIFEDDQATPTVSEKLIQCSSIEVSVNHKFHSVFDLH